jgi:hypothetical protein
MLRLAAVLYILVASALGGAAVITVLTLDMRQGWHIGGAFLGGCLVALPVALLLGRKIYNALQGPKPV